MSSVPGVGLLGFMTTGSAVGRPGRANTVSISPRRPGPNTCNGEVERESQPLFGLDVVGKDLLALEVLEDDVGRAVFRRSAVQQLDGCSDLPDRHL